MKSILVQLPYLSQRIFIDSSMYEHIIETINNEKYDHVFIVVDHNANKYHAQEIEKLKTLRKYTACLILKPLPKYKEYSGIKVVVDKLVKYKATRKSCIVAIGGGHVADLVGFVASIYMRGIDFIQIPTSLMAMSDAVIGKVAVNYREHKNLVGAFYSPRFVFCDTNFLKTLPEREIVLALVAIWKHALLVQDNLGMEMIEKYLKSGETTDLERLIYFSLATKNVSWKMTLTTQTDRTRRLVWVIRSLTTLSAAQRCNMAKQYFMVFYLPHCWPPNLEK